jgi:ribosomal protein L37AE/L43A
MDDEYARCYNCGSRNLLYREGAKKWICEKCKNEAALEVWKHHDEAINHAWKVRKSKKKLRKVV